MINKNRQTDSKTDKQSWIDVFARTQKLKSSGDESWKKDVPNIKLSRAFIVVLILHVVAVGGILAFEMFKPNENIASTIPLENEVSKELQQCLLYVSFLQDRVKQLELYNECFRKIIEQENEQKCQTKKN